MPIGHPYYGVSRLKPTIQFLRYILLITLAGGLGGEQALAAEVDSDKWYEVEIIVFAHPETNGLQSEYWLPDPGMPTVDKNVERLTHAVPTANPPPANAAASSTNNNGVPVKPAPVAFQILSLNEMKLTPLVDKFTASAGYKVLLHTAWRQPATKGERGVGVYIDLTADAAYTPPEVVTPGVVQPQPPPPFLGVINLTSTRFLHLGVDMLYRQPELLHAANILDHSSPNFSMGNDSELPKTSSPTPGIAGFRLAESRRIRLDQLHYYDHPLFGAIARVVSVDMGKPTKNP